MTAALSAFAFTWVYLPETKGRTFAHIAEEFRGAEGIPLQDKTGFNRFSSRPGSRLSEPERQKQQSWMV